MKKKSPSPQDVLALQSQMICSALLQALHKMPYERSGSKKEQTDAFELLKFVVHSLECGEYLAINYPTWTLLVAPDAPDAARIRQKLIYLKIQTLGKLANLPELVKLGVRLAEDKIQLTLAIRLFHRTYRELLAQAKEQRS